MSLYDYMLAVEPSRSGTTCLYRRLIAHPSFVAPEIKEAHYYRSARRLGRALRRPVEESFQTWFATA